MQELVIRGAGVVTDEDEPVRLDIEVRNAIITRFASDVEPGPDAATVDVGLSADEVRRLREAGAA